MDMLKKFFPYSFGAAEVKDLVIKIIVYVVAGAVVGAPVTTGMLGITGLFVPLLSSGLVVTLLSGVVVVLLSGVVVVLLSGVVLPLSSVLSL